MEFLDDNAVNPKSDPFGINRRCGKLPFTSPDRTASQRGSERGLVSAPFPCETLAGNQLPSTKRAQLTTRRNSIWNNCR